MVVSPHLLKMVEKETQSRREEAILMKTKQETEPEVSFEKTTPKSENLKFF